MTVRVNPDKCNGCGGAHETRCMRICPGDLFYLGADKKAALRDPRDCWDCAACLKECPQTAVEMYLPIEIGGRGSTLTAKKSPGYITWTLKEFTGRVRVFKIPNDRII